MTGYIIALAVAAAILFGVLTSLLARKKGYSGAYFWLGLFLNILGLIYVAGLPAVHKAAEPAVPAPQETSRSVYKYEPPAAKPAAAPAAAPQPSIPQRKTADAELIAVIAAAVAATLGTDESGFVVRSYRRLKNSKPSWNRAGRFEQLNRY